MTSRINHRLVLALVGLVLIFGTVPGQAADGVPTVRLKETVTVAHGPLSLRDVIVGNLDESTYSLKLGSLPRPGQVKFVSRAYVMMMANNTERPVPEFLGTVTRTRVKRPARELKRPELKPEMTSAVRNQLTDSANLRIEIENVPESIRILPGPYEMSVNVPGVYQSERGSVWYRFSIRQKGSVTRSFRAKVRVTQFREVPVAVRRIDRGTIVQPDLIEWTKRRIGTLRGGIVSEPEEVIGFEVNRSIRADKIIRRSVLEKPIVIERRDAVTVRYRMSGITITTSGKALEDGAVGDEIRVENSSSEEELFAEVINEELVEVNRTINKEGTAE